MNALRVPGPALRARPALWAEHPEAPSPGLTAAPRAAGWAPAARELTDCVSGTSHTRVSTVQPPPRLAPRTPVQAVAQRPRTSRRGGRGCRGGPRLTVRFRWGKINIERIMASLGLWLSAGSCACCVICHRSLCGSSRWTGTWPQGRSPRPAPPRPWPLPHAPAPAPGPALLPLRLAPRLPAAQVFCFSLFGRHAT